jgi:hypothetical protein
MPVVRYKPGTYKCRCLGQGFDESKNGKPFFWIEFEPLEQVNRAGEKVGDCEQYMRTVSLFLSEAAFDMTMGKLRGAGWAGENLEELEPFSGSFSFEGKELLFECGHRTYEGELQENWDLPGVYRASHQTGLAAKLQAVHGKKLSKGGSKKKRSAPKPETLEPPVEQTAPKTDDDDVPF